MTCPVCGKGFNRSSERVIEGLEDQVLVYHSRCWIKMLNDDEPEQRVGLNLPRTAKMKTLMDKLA